MGASGWENRSDQDRPLRKSRPKFVRMIGEPPPLFSRVLGVLNIQVHYHENVMTGFIILAIMLKDLFHGRPSKFQCTKVLSLRIGLGVSCDDAEAVFCAAMFPKFIFSTPLTGGKGVLNQQIH